MPMKTKYRRKSRKPRKTTRRKYTPKRKGTFKTKVKKALMQMSETKSVGRFIDQSMALGSTSASWVTAAGIFPQNQVADMRIEQGTGPMERIGNRITLTSIRIPMYLVNQTPETLRVRIIVIRQRTNIPGGALREFITPLGESEAFDAGHPWQADWPINKEFGHVVKQRTFNLNGLIDWGAQTTGFPGHRPIQFTGNSGVKKVEMGFKLNRRQYFDDVVGDIHNIDQYIQYVYVWRLNANTIPYELNHNLEGLGNLHVRQYHKVYFKDV